MALLDLPIYFLLALHSKWKVEGKGDLNIIGRRISNIEIECQKSHLTLTMAHNEKLTARVREALSHLGDVEEKKMFSGITFMVNGKMCISVGDDRIMCRIDPTIHDDVVERNGARTVHMKGRDYIGYVYVSEEGIKAKRDFDFWVGLSLEFNKKAKASKSSEKKKRPAKRAKKSR